MSTTYRVSNYVTLPTVILSVALLTAVAVAWSGSTSSGGSHAAEIDDAIEEVSKVTPLTPLCKVVAHRLVETAVKRKVTVLRPTRGFWAGKEAEVASIWEAAKCPTAALVGIAYGSSSIANADQRERVAKAARN
ncbi:hypothetical protein HFN89_04640 [Rhizobium laguerreae]|nr:hypothetical protein [Rhizobium laguerreae]